MTYPDPCVTVYRHKCPKCRRMHECDALILLKGEYVHYVRCEKSDTGIVRVPTKVR